MEKILPIGNNKRSLVTFSKKYLSSDFRMIFIQVDSNTLSTSVLDIHIERYMYMYVHTGKCDRVGVGVVLEVMISNYK